LEPRRKHTARSATRRVKKANKKEKTGGALSLRHIAELIAYGEITVGEKFPIGRSVVSPLLTVDTTPWRC
jgi:hypothetical protein